MSLDPMAVARAFAEYNASIARLEAELAAERERWKAAEAALRTIKKSTYICTASLQDWQYCVLEAQRVADAAMKD